MIEAIKASIDLTCMIINYSLYISYKIGHTLVNIIGFLQKLLYKLTFLLYEISGAVFESLTTFYQDVVQNFQHVLRTISSVDIISYISDIRKIVQSIVLVVITLCNLAVNIVASVVTAIQAVLLSPKYFLLYLSKTTWSIIFGIKETFNDIGAFFSGSIQFLAQKARDSLVAGVLFWTNLPQAIYEFILEIPVESILGMTLSCCLIYLFARFYITVFSFLYRQLKRLLRNMQRRYTELRRYFISRNTRPQRVAYRRPVLPTRRPNIRAERRQAGSPKSEESDRYCVICQEQLKCILLLPCKHLCMCNQCVNTLQMYNNICPICRSDIETTMQIFV